MRSYCNNSVSFSTYDDYIETYPIDNCDGDVFNQTMKIQFVEGKELRHLADSLTVYYKTIEPERGNIYTENGDLMSTSLPFFEIRMDFRSEAMTDSLFNKNVDSLAYVFAKEIGNKTKAAYKKDLIKNRQKGNRYYLVKRNVKYPQLQAMKKWPFFREGRYKSGMIILQKNERKTPFGMLAHRTIGYVRDEGKVKVGIEGKFDDYLKGVKGEILVQKIARGNSIPLNGKGDIQPKTGQDIYLNIDVNMQDLAESALVRSLKDNNADHGSVILMEVSTGKIKAISNLNYNKNLNRYIESYNYAVGEATEPGSTFKLISMAALIDDGFVNIDDVVNLEGGEKKYADRIMRDDHHDEEQNDVTVSQAFAMSSNVAVSKLTQDFYGKNYNKFYDKLKSFHITNPVGIEIEGEALPVIYPPKEWSLVSLPWMSIGYEVQLTPLQTLTFYNAIANNGKMMKPYLVSSIKEYDNVVKQFKPVVIDKRVVSESTVQSLRAMLIDVVENGTARNIKSSNVSMAGKTGTSIVADRDKGYTNKIYQASFAGFFPAENPKYSCIVVINNPRNGRIYGTEVAAPVFGEIANKIYAKDMQMHKNIEEKPVKVNSSLPLIGNVQSTDAKMIYNNLGFSFHSDEGVEYGITQKQNNSVGLKVNPMIENLMPNVVGMDLRDAFYVLENRGLKIIYRGKGKVKKQSIAVGKRISEGAIVELDLSL
ncbi:MAG: penicillin-binding protein, partial [Chitinophagales bacterium]